MPAYGNSVLDKGYAASAAITAKRLVKGTAQGVVGPVTATTDVPVGVSMFGVTAGDIAKDKGMSVRGSGGIAEVEAGAAVAAFALVSFDNQGRVITATTGTRVVGQAQQAAAGAGDQIAVRLTLPGYIAP
jgi:hypothetical protein